MVSSVSSDVRILQYTKRNNQRSSFNKDDIFERISLLFLAEFTHARNRYGTSTVICSHSCAHSLHISQTNKVLNFSHLQVCPPVSVLLRLAGTLGHSSYLLLAPDSLYSTQTHISQKSKYFFPLLHCPISCTETIKIDVGQVLGIIRSRPLYMYVCTGTCICRGVLRVDIIIIRRTKLQQA